MSTEVLTAMIRTFLSIVVLFIEGQELCSIDICLTWKVTLDRLTLICRLNDLKHRVYIDNQHNKTVGDCFSTNSPPCESYHSNGSIQFKKEKQETVFTVKGQINEYVNGNWTCRHGLNKDIAIVDVTVLTIKERGDGSSRVNHKDDSNKSDNVIDTNCVIKDNQNEANDNSCIAALLCWFVVCFVIFMILFRLLASISIRLSELGIDDLIDKCTLRLCTSKRFFTKKTVNVRKNIFLMLIIISCMGIVSFFGYTAKGQCSNSVIALVAVFGCVLGMLSSVFIISIEDKNNTIEGNGNPDGGNDNQGGGNANQGGGNVNQNGGNGNQDGGNGNQGGGNGNQDGGYDNQGGGNGNQGGGNGNQGGGNGNQDGGNGNQGGGNGNQDGGNGNQGGGNGNQGGRNGNQDGDNGYQDGGNGNQDGGNGNQDGKHGNQDGGIGNQDGGIGNQDGGIGNQDGRNGNQTNGENGNQTYGESGNQTNGENGNKANEENDNHEPTQQSQLDHQQNIHGENIEITETPKSNNPKKRTCKNKRQTKKDESIKEMESSKKPFLSTP